MQCGYVSIIGPTNSGKSTLLNALLGKKLASVSSKINTTRSRFRGIKSTSSYQIIFVDTPGFLDNSRGNRLRKHLSSEVKAASSELDVCLLLLDAAECSKKIKKEGEASIREELEAIKSSSSIYGFDQIDILGLTKVDLFDKDVLLPIISICSKIFFLDTTPRIFPISSTKTVGLKELEREIVSLLPEREAIFSADAMTDSSEQYVAAEIIREKLFSNLHQELPYKITVLVTKWEDSKKLLVIAGTIFVEKDQQKAIVIGNAGSSIKRIGTAARVELENLFGKKIQLELFVKTEKDWSQTAKGLQKVGFFEY